jgi:hypothetical protein
VSDNSWRDSASHPADIIRHPVVRAFLLSAMVMGTGMALLTAGVLWFALRGPTPKLSTIEVWFVVGLSAGLTFMAIWIVSVPSANYGISLEAEGVATYERTYRLGRGRKWVVPWEELQNPIPPTRLWEDVTIRSRPKMLFLSREQARAVLLDPRCPIRASLPESVSRFIGVGTDLNQ